MRKKWVFYIFLFLIVIRSSLDIFTDTGFYIGLFYINVPSIVSIFIIILSTFYIVFKGKVKIDNVGKAFGLWILLILPFIFVTIYRYNYAGGDAIREYIRLFTLFLVFLLFYNFTYSDNLDKIINCLFISLVIPFAVAIYQLITQTGSIDQGINRVYGTLAHPNVFAYFLVLFIGITYWKLKIAKFNIWFALLLLLEVALLISTFSLSGYVMFVIITILVLSGSNKKQKVAIFFLMVLFLIIVFATPQFGYRIDNIKKIEIDKTLSEKQVVESFTWRIVNWANLLELWKEKPVIGYGLETTHIINTWKTREGTGYASHSDYIKYLLETGLLGLLSYVITFSFIGLFIYNKYRLCKELKMKMLLYVIMSVFLAWQFIALVGNPIRSTTFQFYFWGICGIAFRISNVEKTMGIAYEQNKTIDNLSS